MLSALIALVGWLIGSITVYNAWADAENSKDWLFQADIASGYNLANDLRNDWNSVFEWTMADKIVVLNAGQVEQVGAPMDLYNHPATAFVAGFIGSPRMNIFEGDIAAKLGCKTYGIHPEHVTLSTSSGQWKGTGSHIERLGADTIVHLNTEDLGALVVRTNGDVAAREGDDIFATPDAAKEFRK